ncbi:MAG: prepilin peptidase [Lachnospiraceae bacterium]|nr:prepilin peptidase [Lachnospiraceae bacterium]
MVFTDIVIFIIFAIFLIAISVCDIKNHKIPRITIWAGLVLYFINFLFTKVAYDAYELPYKASTSELPYNTPAYLTEFFIYTLLLIALLFITAYSKALSGIGFGDIKLVYVLLINFRLKQTLRFVFIGGVILLAKELICFLLKKAGLKENNLEDNNLGEINLKENNLEKSDSKENNLGESNLTKRIPLAPYLTLGFIISQIFALLNII